MARSRAHKTVGGSMTSSIHNDLLLRALRRQPVARTPVWMMRQAGRYLPEYRATRAKAGDFLTLCKTPELACEVTLQPLERFPLDAAILFSDILTIPDAMGLGLYFAENEGPRFERPLQDARAIEQLPIPDPGAELRYVTDAVSLIRRELNGRVPLIGFAGSPWTLATYMVEGGSSKSFHRVKAMLYDTPALMHTLLQKITDATVAYLNAQIAAGAQAVMVFDTWGGVLTPDDYRHFSLAYLQQIVERTDRQQGSDDHIPCILFSKGAGAWLEAMADTGCDALGLDWTINIGEARQRVGDKVALQGNLDPSMLYASPDTIRRAVKRIIDDFGGDTGHVFNLGHGILPDVPVEHAEAMILAVHEFGKHHE